MQSSFASTTHRFPGHSFSIRSLSAYAQRLFALCPILPQIQRLPGNNNHVHNWLCCIIMNTDTARRAAAIKKTRTTVFVAHTNRHTDINISCATYDDRHSPPQERPAGLLCSAHRFGNRAQCARIFSTSAYTDVRTFVSACANDNDWRRFRRCSIQITWILRCAVCCDLYDFFSCSYAEVSVCVCMCVLSPVMHRLHGCFSVATWAIVRGVMDFFYYVCELW